MKVKYSSILIVCLLVFFISVASASAAEYDQTDVTNVTTSGEVIDVQTDEACGDAVLGISVEDDSLNDSSIADDIKIDDIHEGVIGAPLVEDDLLGADMNSLYDQIKNGGSFTLPENYQATASSTYSKYNVDLPISNSLTLIGTDNYNTIDANGKGRIFHVNSGKVLKCYDVTFTNGNSGKNTKQTVEVGYGGAIYFAGNNDGSYFEGCSFISNIADSTSGSSSSSGSGSAVYFGGTQDNITFKNCYFSSNNAKYAGVTYFSGHVTNVKFIDCIFENDAGKRMTMWFNGNSENITFLNCKVNNNHVNDLTAGIYFGSSSLPYFKNINFTNCEFINNSAKSDTAIRMSNVENMIVDNCNFTNNDAYSTASGEVCAGINFLKTAKNVNITNSYFSKNSAQQATCICFSTTSKEVSNINIYNCNFTGNNATLNSASGIGGAALYFNSYNSVNITESYFANNKALNSMAGALYSNPSTSGTPTLSITKSEFDDNYATSGGAVYLTGKNAQFIYSNFAGNNATTGGAVFILANYTKFVDSKFINNNATTGGAVVIGKGSSGSDLSGSYTSFDNVTFKDNSAKKAGAIDWGSKIGNVTDSKFINNTATGGDAGGAIYIEDRASDIKIINSDFIKNNASSSSGGAISGKSNDVTIKDSRFDENTAENAYGGAIYWETGDRLNISNCNFTENFAKSGAAVDIMTSSEDANIEKSLFDKNKGTDRGAIYFSSPNGKISESNFTNNTAGNYGGAISLNTQNVIISKCRFEDNNASSAGALYITGSNNKVLDSNFISNNASESGGAIAIYHNSNGASNNVINNTAFVSNHARNGGAIYIGGVAANNEITYCTFDGNTAYNGGAVYIINDKNNPLRYSDFRNNNATYNGGAAYITYSGTPYVDWNLFSNLASEVNGKVTWQTSTSPATYNIYQCTFDNNHDYLINISMVYDELNAVFTVNVPSRVATGKVHIRISNSTTTVYDDDVDVTDGVATLDYTHAVAGTYTIVAGFENDDYLYKENSTVYTLSLIVGDFTDLQRLINKALDNNEHELTLYSHYNWNPDRDNATILIPSNFKIIGNGFTINATGHSSIFNITGNDVVIEHLVLVNGSNSTGGAIVWSGNNGVLNNTEFINNTADNGGAVAWLGNNGTIYNCEFSLNDASQGNAIYVEGNVTIDKSRIYDANAVYVNNGATVNLTNTTINNPTSDYAVSNDGTLYLGDNTFDSIILNNAGGLINSATYTVIANNETIVIDEGEDAVVNATIKDDNGNIIKVASFSVNVNGTDYTMNFENGNYSATVVDLVPGIYPVTPSVVGLGANVINSTSVKVIGKTSIALEIVKNNEGEQVVINATISPAIEGNITFSVPEFGIDKEITIKNGTATLILDEVPVGSYTVTATSAGDEVHTGNSSSGSFIINYRDAKFDISITNASYGENATITVVTDATGNLTFMVIGGNSFEVPIVNGTAKLNVTGLSPGVYPVVVAYPGNDVYFKFTHTTEKIEIYKVGTDIEATPAVTPVHVGDDVIINVLVNSSAEGIATVTLTNGSVYKAFVQNGKASIVISNLPADSYENIKVDYLGDDYYQTNSTTVNFVVEKYDENSFNMTVNVSDVQLGEDANITVTLPEDATGTVTVNVNGTDYYPDINNGVAILTVPASDLTVIGTYEVNVTYSGDDKYAAKDVNGSEFNVTTTANYNVNLTVVPAAEYGGDTVISVEVPSDVTGSEVIATIDGVDYVISINDEGKGSITLNNLSAGNHDITVTYPGDDKYAAVSNSSTFNIREADPKMNVTFEAIDVGQVAQVNINLPVNATGTVTVDVNGTKYDGVLVGGHVIVDVPNLGNGTYVVKVSYPGDGNYTADDFEGTLVVSKVVTNVTVNVTSSIEVGDDAVINITMEPAITTIVTLTVGDEDYDVVVKNGFASYSVPGLGEGSYNVTVTYAGDAMYAANVTTSSIVVNKKEDYGFDITFVEGENGEVTVVINAPDDATGNVTIYVDDETPVNVTVTSGSYVVSGLAPGNHTINVTYPGDSKYAAAEANKTVTVGSWSDYNLTVSADNVTYGNPVDVTVVVPEGATGNVTFIVDGGTAVEVPIEDGKAVLTLDKPVVGPHSVYVEFGDDRYADHNATVNFTVSKSDASDVPSDMVVTPGNETDPTVVNVTIPEDATGNVTVIIDGVPYDNFTVVNGTVDVTLPILPPGDHNITVVYPGDDNYPEIVKTEIITIPKISDYERIVAVDSIDVGEVAVINITLPGDANGGAVVDVNGAKYFVDVVNGTAQLNISGLGEGNYPVEVTFQGDNNYTEQTFNTSFDVSKVDDYQFDVNVTVDEYGNVIVDVTAPEDATGNVTVSVGNETVTVPVNSGPVVISGLDPDTYPVNVTYTGDGKYTPNSYDNTTTIDKWAMYELDVSADNVTYGNPVDVTVVVPEGATGNVTFIVDGGTAVEVPIEDGKAVLTLDKPVVGPHSVYVEFGDDRYADHNATVNFTVSKSDASDVPSDMVVTPGNETDPTVVNVTIPEDATGNVTVIIDGVPYDNFTVVNGTVDVTLPILPPGDHNITVVYPGDDNYPEIVKTEIITIPKIDDYQFDVSVSPIDVGEDAVVDITLPADANGEAVVEVNGVKYTVDVVNGVGQLNVSGLANGTYPVTVTFNGDNNYTKQSRSDKIIVNKVEEYPFNVVTDVDEYGNVLVEVTGPSDATGDVTIKVGDKEVTVPINSGVVNITGLDPKDYDVDVSYAGDDKYVPDTAKESVSIPKWDIYDFDVSADDATYGEDVVITVDVPEGATGKVNITVDGVTHQATIKDGVATYTVKKPAAGEHDVLVEFEDARFAYKNATASFTVDKNSDITPTVDITPGDENTNTTVKATLPQDATGSVTVVIDGKEYKDVPIVNGKIDSTLPILAPGDHNITIVYPGDDNYEGFTQSDVVTIPTVDDYTVIATSSDIIVGGIEVIDVILPEDATGMAHIDVADTGYYINITNGKGSLELPELPEGTYTATVTYLGDNVYSSKQNTTKFTVSPKGKFEPNVTIDITGDDGGNITVELPEDATGDITVVIDGKEYAVSELTDGKAVIPVNDLAPGNHTVDVIYSGDDRYEGGSVSNVTDVSKVTKYDFEVTANDIMGGEKTDITISLPEDVNGVVLIDIADTGYYVNVTDGKAKLEVANLPVGEYDVVAHFDGNDYYDSKVASDSFKVIAVDSDVKITVGDDSVVIELPKDATGEVIVSIDGNETSVPIVDGKAVVDISDLSVGNHTIDVTYPGDDKYGPSSDSAVKEVKKQECPIDVDIDELDKIVVKLPEDATGNVTVTVDGIDYVVPINNGEAVVEVPGISSGEHNVTVKYNGNDKYAPESENTTIDIPVKVVIYAPDVVKYFSGPERFAVSVIDVLSGNGVGGVEVKIKLNGIVYTRTTNSDGSASIAIVLNSANYTAEVTVDEYGYNHNASVEVKPTVIANDIIKVFRNSTGYTGLFVDGEGNPLPNTKVMFNINGVFYNRTTDANGIAKLSLNLEKGDFIITAFNPVTGEMISNNIKVFTLIESSDLVKYYKNDSQFVVRLRAADGSWVGAGEVVSFNIQGRLYNRTTNATGHAVLKVNLEPGTYSITSYYKDCREGNTIEVLPVLFADDLSMKYRDGSQFKAKVLDGQGRPYAGQTVTFNVNGVFYNRTTGSDGIAKLNIRLMAGEYIITSEYNGAKLSNTIKIEA